MSPVFMATATLLDRRFSDVDLHGCPLPIFAGDDQELSRQGDWDQDCRRSCSRVTDGRGAREERANGYGRREEAAVGVAYPFREG